MSKTLLLSLLLAILFIQTALSETQNNPFGLWITDEGKAHIELKPCGERLCGVIVWLAEPTDPDTNEPVLDKNNPNLALRAHPIVGLKILEMKPDPEHQGWRGKIYNGLDGNTYKASLRPYGNKVDVEGCIFFGLLCGSQEWTRVGG